MAQTHLAEIANLVKVLDGCLSHLQDANTEVVVAVDRSNGGLHQGVGSKWPAE